MSNGEKTFYIDLVGCEKRKLDAEKILQYFRLNGYTQITDDSRISDADVVVFVSCAFNDEFSALSKKKISHMLDSKEDNAKFILSGCLPEIEPDFMKLSGLIYSVSPRDMNRFDEIVHPDIRICSVPEQNLSFFDNRSYPVPDRDYRSPLLEEYVNSKNGFKLRVTWGCLSSCSYCAVKKATKNLLSKPLDDIKNEMERGLNSGHVDFFVTGGDVGAYGRDLGLSIVELLDLLTSYLRVNLYIQEFNAQWLVKYGDDISRVLEKNINHYRKLFINVPIQSGSDYVLGRMNRHYSSAEVLDAIRNIRLNNHKFRLGSHFIVGFPGETDDMFEETLLFLENANLDFVMVFTYSDYPNAASYRLDGKVNLEVSVKRREILLETQKKIDLLENRYRIIENCNFEVISSIADTIEGWITPSEGKRLFSLAKNLSFGNIVEIGSWKGKSTFILASGLIQGSGALLYSVDHHTGSVEQREHARGTLNTLPDFVSNIRRLNVGSVVNVIVSDSILASEHFEEDVGLIFLDGSHEYIDVRDDFNAWWPKLLPGGIMAFHDTLTKPGVSRFVNEMLSERLDFEDPQLVDEITYIHKSFGTLGISPNVSEFLIMKEESSERVFKMKRGEL